MKKQLLTLSTLFITYFASAQVGVGTTSPSEALDVETSDATKTAIDINNTSTGDPKINFQLNGTTNFSIGIDNSDSDKLKIGTSALETNTRVTLDNSGNMGVGTTSPISTLDVQGSMGLKVTTITAATTLNNTHNVVLCNTGPYTVTLPAAASNTGRTYYIKNIDTDGDDITIDGNGSETIDGDLTFRLDSYKHAVKLICDGTNWHVIEESVNNKQNSQNSFTAVNCNGSIFSWSNVTNATTGKVWMDRNLGASQVATSSTDANSYGDLYQWGRLKDGHQCRTASTTSTLSKDDVPSHGDFITTGGSNWRSSQNDNLWQGVNGINNPCPSGYRVPTEAELEAERTSWSSNNSAGAIASVLKLTIGGGKRFGDGIIYYVNTDGYYWSSIIDGSNNSKLLYISGSNSFIWTSPRRDGFSIRCIKN